jgi:uncharacterized protein with GYD domain
MLFCVTANYTPNALEPMGKNPNTNCREAGEKLVTAAGGKLVAMYGTIADGPGAIKLLHYGDRRFRLMRDTPTRLEHAGNWCNVQF